MTYSSPLTFARAKHMRRAPTLAEQKLWGALRNRRLDGFKFYRQVPVGPYIVDFVSKHFGLVVEVDGATHGDTHEILQDARRNAYLQHCGLQVCRVGNLDVYNNIGGVLEAIHAALLACQAKGPHPALRATFPRGEGTVASPLEKLARGTRD